MFWKLITLSVLLWALAMYSSVTLGGLIHLLPAAAIACIVFRQMTKRPDTEFGRWRPATERAVRR